MIFGKIGIAVLAKIVSKHRPSFISYFTQWLIILGQLSTFFAQKPYTFSKNAITY
jgi:hypothetical protein